MLKEFGRANFPFCSLCSLRCAIIRKSKNCLCPSMGELWVGGAVICKHKGYSKKLERHSSFAFGRFDFFFTFGCGQLEYQQVYDDIMHYQKILAALTETDKIMGQIKQAGGV